jgi:hypothetical protein
VRARLSIALVAALAVLVSLGLLAGLDACEQAVTLDPMLVDGGFADAQPCPVCADVSIDADYDAPDVSIYGVQPIAAPSDAGDASSPGDATRD